MIEQYINEQIEQKVRREVSEQLAPIRSLPEKFSQKLTLTVEDMCEILGIVPDKSGKSRLRNACENGEIPFRRFGRDVIFPRPMVEAWLFGEWKEKEIVKTKVSVIGLADKLR